MADDPITREEVFMSAAAGNDIPLPEPITRQERFLKAIADNAGGSGGGGSGGSGSDTVIVHVSENWVFDKTWQEIYDAIASGKLVRTLYSYNQDSDYAVITYPISVADCTNGVYSVTELGQGSYYTDSPDGYPSGE